MASPGAFSTAVYSSLANKAIPLSQLFSKIKESGAEVVSIGEATHGSKQFYSFRGELTKQLIISNLCDGILIEGDFPDTAALHRYVMGFGTEKETSVDSALSGFARFPRWMWRNETFKSFLVWLHDHNSLLPMDQRVGIWGLDVYSLHISMGEIFKYLEAIDPDVAQQVKELYTCYDRFDNDVQMYGLLTHKGLIKGCRDVSVAALNLIVSKTSEWAKSLPAVACPTDLQLDPKRLEAADAAFVNEMNARVVCDAEAYYAAIFDPAVSSWDLRDGHFFDTLCRVRTHLEATRFERVSSGGSRSDSQHSHVVVWAHNSHLGDARYAHLESPRRELNLGQLLRMGLPQGASLLVGQLTYAGEVTAADDWGDPHEAKRVRPALPNSYEDLLHRVFGAAAEVGSDFALDLRDETVRKALEVGGRRLQRAIGVIYRPNAERLSHYYFVDLARQFDLISFFDWTDAVGSLDPDEELDSEPETYPTGY